MPILHIIIIALVQGITEFLPISSSGHLVLTHDFLSIDKMEENHELIMDMAVHVGTLFAVLLYFRSDVKMMVCAAFSKSSQSDTGDTKLLNFVVLGSVPVVIAGFALNMMYPEWLRSGYVVAWSTIIFGIVLYISDRFFPSGKDLTKLSYKDAFFIGLAQVLALIPGTSRSGITMSAARFCGVSRVEAARFSLLLGIIAISGAGILGAIDALSLQQLDLGYDMALAVLLAFVSGYIAIVLMMKWLARSSFTPFVIYRIALGIALLCSLHFNLL